MSTAATPQHDRDAATEDGRARDGGPADPWMHDPDLEAAAPLRRSTQMRRYLEERLAQLGQLADEASPGVRDAFGQQTIDLRELPAPAQRYREVFHDAVGQVQQLHQVETDAVDALTQQARSPQGRAWRKATSDRADAPPMSEQEPATQPPTAPAGASIPLTTKAQVARRDEIWAKNRARLDAAKARTA